jgi:hypothetical protein
MKGDGGEEQCPNWVLVRSRWSQKRSSLCRSSSIFGWAAGCYGSSKDSEVNECEVGGSIGQVGSYADEKDEE